MASHGRLNVRCDPFPEVPPAKAERARQPAPEVKQAAASGVADFRAQFEVAKLAEAGKQQARQAFEQFKAEQQAQQRQAEQRGKARLQEAADRLEMQRAERETKKPERDDDSPGWSR